MVMGNTYGGGHEGTYVVMVIGNTCGDGHGEHVWWWSWENIRSDSLGENVVMVMGNTCSDGHEGTCVVMMMWNTCSDGHGEHVWWWSWRNARSDRYREHVRMVMGTHIVMAMGNTCSDDHVCPFIHPFACLNLWTATPILIKFYTAVVSGSHFNFVVNLISWNT
jgi:hypothetical protein